MDDCLPGDLTCVGVPQFLANLIAVPKARHTEGGAAHEVQVFGVIGGTGLGEHVHANVIHDIGRRTIIPFYRPVEQLVHHRGVLRGHNLLAGVIPVVQDDVAVVVLHIGVGVGLVIIAAIGKDTESRRHLTHRDAVGHAAQSHSGQAVGVFLCEGGEMEFLSQPLIAGFRSEGLSQPGSGGVLRDLDGLVHIHGAGVLAGHVLGAFLGGALSKIARHRDIVEHGAIGDLPCLDAQRIDAQRFEGRAGLPGGVGGVVIETHALSFVTAAHHRDDPAGVGVHNKQARLNIRVLGHILPADEHVLQVRLDLGVHGGVDLQAGVVDHIHGDVVGIAVCVHQVRDDVLKHGVDIPVPVVDVLLFFHAFRLLGLVAIKGHGGQFCGGLVVLLLCDGGQLALHLGADHQFLVIAIVNAVGKLPHTVQNCLGAGL